MPLIAYTVIADSAVDPDSPLDSALITALRDNIAHVRDYVGGVDYVAARNHNHDGVNSAESEVGSNSVRNGSFESGVASWTLASYSGQPVVASNSMSHDGAQSLAITSTNAAVGGGEAVSAPMPCAGYLAYLVSAMIRATAANVSCVLKVLWLDNSKAQISESTVFTTTTTPTSFGMPVSDMVVPPAGARFYRIKFIGGIPGVGVGVGTVHLDGVFAAPIAAVSTYGTRTRYSYPTLIASNSLVNVELHNVYVPVGGVYTVRFQMRTTIATGVISQGRIYVNGVAAGTVRQTTGLSFVEFSEDIVVPAGATVQIFGFSHNAGNNVEIQNIKLLSGNTIPSLPAQTAIGER